MQAGKRNSIVLLIAAASAACLLAIGAAGCGGGTAQPAGALSLEDIWARAQEAEEALNSWHMEIASYYENTAYGSGHIQSIIIDVNGEDLHEQDLILGQVYSEYMRIGDKDYSKDMKSGTWQEVPASGEAAATDTSASEYSSQILELPSLAESQEHVGTEPINERSAEHFHFVLGPEGVLQMFEGQSSFDFSGNSGGEVDVWIDAEDYYLSRYELVIRNVIIPEQIGVGDLRFVVNISDVNEDIEISL